MQPPQLRLVDGSEPLVPIQEHGHVVQFFERPELLVASVADYLAEGLIAGQPGVVIAREEHRVGIVARLQAKGLDIGFLTAEGRLEVIDAHEVLAEFMIINSPSPQRFTAVVGGAIARLSRVNGNAAVRAYGEMVDILWESGNTLGALRLEELWNSLAETHDFRLFCAYSMGHFLKAGSEDALREICLRHTRAGALTAAAPCDAEDARAETALLQERVNRLQAELSSRLARGRDLQAALRRLGVNPVS